MIKPTTRRVLPHFIATGAILLVLAILLTAVRTKAAFALSLPMGFLAIASAIRSAELFIRSMTEKLEVDGDKVLVQQGIFATSTSQLQLAYIKNVRITQSFMQRVFGVGNLILYTTATGTNPEDQIIFKEIASLHETQQHLWEAMSGSLPKVEVVPRNLRAVSQFAA